ncbi:MAG: polysaccharide biosynthesis/export family protein [Bacteroidales bacterium]|jgi:polysaccharide export outer membrane protein
MLRTGVDYQYTPLPTDSNQLYKISPNDIISFALFTNDGERLVDPVNGTIGGNTLNFNRNDNGVNGYASSGGGLTLQVEYDGTVKFPVLGRIQIAGLTSRETEKMLEEKFTVYFNKPFVQVHVSNNRIILIRGGTNSSVVPLYNSKTTLFELIAQSGGIGEGKSHKIKIIRRTKEGNQVFQIDLSRVQNIDQGNIVLQANDIIYIEPRDKVPEEFMNTISPYMSLISTILLIYYTLGAKK